MISMNRLELWSDAHSTNMIGIHIVWCTKFRRPVMKEGVDVIVKQSIAQTCADNDWKMIDMEVMPDHIHIFIQIRPSDTPSNVVKILKSTSAIAVFYSFPKLKGQKFWGSGLWSRGTYYGSVGQISQDTIIKYIDGQKTK